MEQRKAVSSIIILSLFSVAILLTGILLRRTGPRLNAICITTLKTGQFGKALGFL